MLRPCAFVHWAYDAMLGKVRLRLAGRGGSFRERGGECALGALPCSPDFDVVRGGDASLTGLTGAVIVAVVRPWVPRSGCVAAGQRRTHFFRQQYKGAVGQPFLTQVFVLTQHSELSARSAAGLHPLCSDRIPNNPCLLFFP